MYDIDVKTVLNFFYNPLQATKGDQGQDSNDVGIGGSSNNLWMQQSNSTLSFATLEYQNGVWHQPPWCRLMTHPLD